MIFAEFPHKHINFLKRKLVMFFFQYLRIVGFEWLSTCKNIVGCAVKIQPVLITGKGGVEFSKNVHFGVNPSPFFYNGYINIDSRRETSKIFFGENVWVNNNCSFISEGEGIEIGRDTLIGTACEIVDSDFHDINPSTRRGGVAKKGRVVIGENVFLGSNVKIMKGVTIGNNSVIANGAVVIKSIPENVVAAGIPAKVVRAI